MADKKPEIISCKACGGTGTQELFTGDFDKNGEPIMKTNICGRCNGGGVVEVSNPSAKFIDCPKCGGSGKVYGAKCRGCDGLGQIKKP